MKQMEERIRRRDAADERQYMLDENYEVYEKQGTPIGALSYHYHNFYEIIYVLEGEYSSFIEKQIYHLHKGDFLLINQNVLHKYHHIEKKHDSSRRIILWITDSMLVRLSGGEENLAACFQREEACAYHFPVHYEEMLRGFLLKLAMSEVIEGESEEMKKVLARGYLTLFFCYLNSLCARREYFFAGEETELPPMVETVSSYIDAHLGEKLTVEVLAEQVHMSKYHFVRKFKELTGVTVHGYLIDKRLIKACRELKAGSSIEQAYQRAGFADYTSFLRNFKNAYGVSPKKYKDFYPD